MGIGGLYWHVCENIPRAVQNLDIAKEVVEFRSKHERDPILIIDIRQFAQIAVQREDINMVCGGRHQWISALFRRILTGLKKTGAKMVFFAPGNQLNDEPYIFIPKQELAYQSAHDILTRIDKGEPIRQILESKHRSIRATLAVEYNLTKVCKPFGELHYNYVRHNQEIARYANEHKADVLAIISGDSEFLVFDGEYENWPVMEMDWIKLTGIRVSRQAVLDGLKVTRKQLAMVGALAGSAYLPSFIPPMKRFNTKLVRVGPKSSKIVDLAAYVQTIPQTPNGEFDLAFVARDVFGDDYTEEELNTINNGLAVFNLNFKKPAVADPMLRHLMRYDRLLYKLLTDKVFCVQDIAYTDYISVRSKTYADLMCPLMLRILGILFAETKDTEFTREICMKFTHDELYEVIAVPPWYPPADLHLPFKVLYEDHDNDSNQKWRLLLWTLDVDDSCWEALKSLHKHMVTPVATLMYLVKQGELSIMEADAILMSEYDTRYKNMPRNFIYTRKHNGRYVRVAHLYIKIYEWVCGCFRACGLPAFSDMIRFDAAHFHNYAEDFEEFPSVRLESIELIKDEHRLYATCHR